MEKVTVCWLDPGSNQGKIDTISRGYVLDKGDLKDGQQVRIRMSKKKGSKAKIWNAHIIKLVDDDRPREPIRKRRPRRSKEEKLHDHLRECQQRQDEDDFTFDLCPAPPEKRAKRGDRLEEAAVTREKQNEVSERRTDKQRTGTRRVEEADEQLRLEEEEPLNDLENLSGEQMILEEEEQRLNGLEDDQRRMNQENRRNELKRLEEEQTRREEEEQIRREEEDLRLNKLKQLEQEQSRLEEEEYRRNELKRLEERNKSQQKRLEEEESRRCEEKRLEEIRQNRMKEEERRRDKRKVEVERKQQEEEWRRREEEWRKKEKEWERKMAIMLAEEKELNEKLENQRYHDKTVHDKTVHDQSMQLFSSPIREQSIDLTVGISQYLTSSPIIPEKKVSTIS